MTKKHCAECKKLFDSIRANHKYCSDRCKWRVQGRKKDANGLTKAQRSWNAVKADPEKHAAYNKRRTDRNESANAWIKTKADPAKHAAQLAYGRKKAAEYRRAAGVPIKMPAAPPIVQAIRQKRYNKTAYDKWRADPVRVAQDRAKSRKHYQENKAYYYEKTLKRQRLRKEQFCITSRQWNYDTKCCYCGIVCTKENKATQEHFLAIENKGMHSYDNLHTACSKCNSSKGDKYFIDWLARKIDKFFIDDYTQYIGMPCAN